MQNKEMVEFLFKINFREHVLLEEKIQFLDGFVVFIEKNGWFCGGTYDGMGVYDIAAMTNYSEFQTKVLEYVKLRFSGIVTSISVGEYDERTGDIHYRKNLAVKK